MSVFKPEEFKLAEWVGRIDYANPFLPERLELERQVLGDEYEEEDVRVWSMRVDRRAERHNMQKLVERVESVADEIRARLSGGKRLTASERQLLGLARAILKRPDILVVDAALAVLDTPTQEQILKNVLASSGSRAVIWVLPRPHQARLFDRVLVIDDGHVIEEGEPETLEARGGRFTALAASPH